MKDAARHTIVSASTTVLLKLLTAVWSAEKESTRVGGHMGQGDLCTVIQWYRENRQIIFVEGTYINLNYVKLDWGLV